MTKEEVALQILLKAMDKFRFNSVEQVAESYNTIIETIRVPEKQTRREPEAAKSPAKHTNRESGSGKDSSVPQVLVNCHS